MCCDCNKTSCSGVKDTRLSRNRNGNFDIYVSSFRNPNVIGQLVSHDHLLGRWRLTLELFGRVFCDDVGAEPGSVISELGGFPVKESKFRREMEKLRNTQQRDLTLDVGIASSRIGVPNISDYTITVPFMLALNQFLLMRCSLWHLSYRVNITDLFFTKNHKRKTINCLMCYIKHIIF